MKRLLPLLLFLIVGAGIASAQQINDVQPKSCVNISNCVLFDYAGNEVWINSGYIVFGVYPNLQTCNVAVAYQGPQPSTSDANPVLYEASFQCPDGTTVSAVVKGYHYYYRSSGRYGSGYRYAVTSGLDEK